MEKCCISSCPKPANLACYNIPTDTKRRHHWMSNIYRNKNAPTITDQDGGAVCSLHFKQNDYIYLLHDSGTSKRKISEDAVPSVFPWTCDWDSNYAEEIEIAQLKEKSAQQSGSETSSLNAGLPEGEAVQLGNVESIGIAPHTVVDEDAYLGSSTNCLDSLSTKTTKNFRVNSMQLKSPSQRIQLSTSTSTSTSRVETSEDEDIKYFDILTQFYYSCTGCEFKSKDIISLKEHRVKHHPQIKSEFTDMNQSSVKSHEVGNKSLSQSLLQVSRSNGKEKRVVPSYGKQGQHKSNDNCNSLHQHISKTHSASEVSAISDSQSNSNKSDPPSASLFATNGRPPSKRSVRKWYPCSLCTFRTPNAKKFKMHVKVNHPQTADTSSVQPTKLAARKKNEVLTSDPAFLDVSSSSLKKRFIKGHYFYFCPDKNCPFRAKDSRAVLNHCRANHPSSLARNDRQPQDMNKTTDSGRKERYFCGLCNFSTHDKKRRMEHDLGHTEDYGYRCSKCSYSVSNHRRLTYHVANHHPSHISCELCHFKAETMTEKKSHCASVHKTATARKSSLRSAEQPLNSDCDLEHVCFQCSFRTSSRDQFQVHEKTHVPNTSGSSTEELDVGDDILRKTAEKIKRKCEDRESSSTVQSTKHIERLVYQCPHCSFWARAVSCFHQHLIAHENTPTFKCSHCDFSARYRIAITKHIKKNANKTHSSACWVLTKPVSDNQYPEYLKTACVPELEYSGTSGIHILGSGEGLKRKTSSNSSGGSWKLSSESSVEEKLDKESVEWVPSASSLSSADVKDDSSSSLCSEITSDSSSEYSESSDTALSLSSKLEAKNKTSKKSTSSTEKPSSRLMILRSSNRTKGPRRKRLRIDSDCETDQHRPLKSFNDSLTKDTRKEKRKFGIPDTKDESNMQLQILPDCPKSSFPVLDEAVAKRDAKEQMIREAQNKINGMRTEELKMAEVDSVSQSELLKLKERKNVVIKQLMILNGEKIEAELQLRTQQCQELKLSIAMCEPEQESELNSNVLAECKNLVAESDAKLTEIKGAIVNLREESEILDSQIKESEESHAGTAQLVEISQCELSEKETELNLLQQELAKSVSDIAQLLDKERTLIMTRTAMCEEELKRLYEKGLSSIREKEKDLLSALADYITDNNDSPNMKESV